MTTKPLTDVVIKDGKVIRKKGYMAGVRARKAARLAKAWQKKAPPKRG